MPTPNSFPRCKRDPLALPSLRQRLIRWRLRPARHDRDGHFSPESGLTRTQYQAMKLDVVAERRHLNQSYLTDWLLHSAIIMVGAVGAIGAYMVDRFMTRHITPMRSGTEPEVRGLSDHSKGVKDRVTL